MSSMSASVKSLMKNGSTALEPLSYAVGIALIIAIFVVNSRAYEALKNNNIEETRNNVSTMINLLWSLYAIYLIKYMDTVYRPMKHWATGSSQVGTIGLILTSIIVACLTYVLSSCTQERCDKIVTASSLEKTNILMTVLVVVCVGTEAFHFLNKKYEPEGKGITSQILELLSKD